MQQCPLLRRKLAREAPPHSVTAIAFLRGSPGVFFERSSGEGLSVVSIVFDAS